MKTFLFQGDSITDANRDDENNDNFGLGCGYAFLLAAEAEKNSKGRIRFINRGKSGDRITDVYARIKEDIINLKPDYMSLLIGVNDVWHDKKGTGVPLKKYKELVSDIFDRCSAAGIKVIVLTATMITEDPEAKENKKLARKLSKFFYKLGRFYCRSS